MNTRRIVDLICVGVLWGLLALLLGHRAYGVGIWTGVVCAPAIGLAIGAMLQQPFEDATTGRRRVIALCSLYLGATLFAVMIGLGTILGPGAGHRHFHSALIEPILGTWWGITFTGFFLVLWPLAYATHWWLEWRATR
ncbi:MAG: hypothetical protein IPO52_10490 [Gemmatimonadetes bacterium]|jgi:hypothetical protein|nr:hypothetical protein [Gemmatimonadota bacterium]MBP6444857.1 hypothetical protein [Gemmatimonadales bacterium]MBP6572449.1 hypothetical protein [Gemmatimonadales bacterium]MBP7620804.1 hypothetical protein [Gemmatimonadales bacterium]MBP9898305.1 hypothetical protein [Gemmatimonadales bacterium]